VLKPSDLVRLRARRADELAAVLHPGEAGYEETLRYALREPLFDTITTRLRFTTVEETEKLVAGFSDELTRRGIKA
jgi:hypothetical protein